MRIGIEKSESFRIWWSTGSERIETAAHLRLGGVNLTKFDSRALCEQRSIATSTTTIELSRAISCIHGHLREVYGIDG